MAMQESGVKPVVEAGVYLAVGVPQGFLPSPQGLFGVIARNGEPAPLVRDAYRLWLRLLLPKTREAIAKLEFSSAPGPEILQALIDEGYVIRFGPETSSDDRLLGRLVPLPLGVGMGVDPSDRTLGIGNPEFRRVLSVDSQSYAAWTLFDGRNTLLDAAVRTSRVMSTGAPERSRERVIELSVRLMNHRLIYLNSNS